MATRRPGLELRGETPSRGPLAVAADLSWRLLALALSVAVLGLAAAELRLVILPIFLALLITALLVPVVDRLRARGWPRGTAPFAVLVSALAAFAGVMALVGPAFVAEFGELRENVVRGAGELARLIVAAPLGISDRDIEGLVDRGIEWGTDNPDVVAGGVLGGAVILVEIVVGTLLAVVLSYFFLRDGGAIWRWLMALAPRGAQGDLDQVARRAWGTLGAYLRGITIVALFDSIFIGVALVVLGVPVALPLAVLVFFGAYVPFAGAIVTGAAAVLVALVSEGPVVAAAVAGAVLVVQQVESNVLHPIVVGKALELHPVAILLAVTSGAIVAGVVGAVVAAPLAATVARAGSYLRERWEREEVRTGAPDRQPPGEPVPNGLVSPSGSRPSRPT